MASRTKCKCKRRKSTKSIHPLLIVLIIGSIIVFSFYIIVFIEIDGIHLYNILSNSTINKHDIFKDTPQTSLLKLIEKGDNNENIQNMNSNSEQYFKMFEHIHKTPFASLSPQLQTRHLHELFRYRIIESIQSRQIDGNPKQSGQRELMTVLNSIYTAHNTGINFVQIGACDGDWHASNDPIQQFILQSADWHGVMLEPVPYLFETLKINIGKSIPEWKHRIVLINAALSDHNGFQTFFIVNPHFGEEMPDETHALKHQIGSFNKGHIEKHLKIKRERGQLSHELDHYIDGINVTAMSAMSVVEEYRGNREIVVRDGSIDVLTIDAEGFDFVVLKGFLVNTTIRPLMVIYENLHLSREDKSAAVELLHEYGYISINDYWNTIGIRLANL